MASAGPGCQFAKFIINYNYYQTARTNYAKEAHSVSEITHAFSFTPSN